MNRGSLFTACQALDVRVSLNNDSETQPSRPQLLRRFGVAGQDEDDDRHHEVGVRQRS